MRMTPERLAEIRRFAITPPGRDGVQNHAAIELLAELDAVTAELDARPSWEQFHKALALRDAEMDELNQRLAASRVARGLAEFKAGQNEHIARVAVDAAKTLAAGLEYEQKRNAAP